MTRPTVAQAEAWKPNALCKTADAWDAAATDLSTRVDDVVHGIGGSRDFWTGSAADAARGHGGTIGAAGALAARCLITAAVAARDGAGQIERRAGRRSVLAQVAAARAAGFVVADDGVVTGGGASPVLISLVGGSPAGDGRPTHHQDRGRPRQVGRGRRRRRARHHRGAEPRARTAAAERTHRGVAGPARRRRRGLVRDRPGPDRRPDRRDDTRTAPTPYR